MHQNTVDQLHKTNSNEHKILDKCHNTFLLAETEYLTIKGKGGKVYLVHSL